MKLSDEEGELVGFGECCAVRAGETVEVEGGRPCCSVGEDVWKDEGEESVQLVEVVLEWRSSEKNAELGLVELERLVSFGRCRLDILSLVDDQDLPRDEGQSYVLCTRANNALRR